MTSIPKKLVIMLEYTVLWTYVTNGLNGKEIVGGLFMKKYYEKQTKKSLELKK